MEKRIVLYLHRSPNFKGLHFFHLIVRKNAYFCTLFYLCKKLHIEVVYLQRHSERKGVAFI